MDVLQEIRLALRRLRRNPLLTASIAGTLALAVGATTSIYSVVDGVLLKPLAFPNAEALVRISADYQATNQRDVGLSLPELEEHGTRSGAFEAVTGIWAINANITGGDRPERVEVLLASANYFDLLGIPPALGRTFNARDEVPGIATVAVISDGLWRRAFGGDPAVIGKTLRIDEDVYEIVGVMPPSFRHPSTTLETDVEVWAPAGWRSNPFGPPSHSARFIPSAIGRLAPGVTVDQARARVEGMGTDLVREHPDDYPARLGWTPRVHPLAADLVAGVRPALLMLLGGVVFLMLIAISNISNLLLVRAVEREREIAIQRALGATRLRILLNRMAEGAALAVIGGALGFLASLWGVELLLQLVPDRLPRASEIRVDGRVFAFAALTSLVTGLLVGLAAALPSSHTDLVERLKSGGRAVQGGVRARARNALVVAQVAIAVVLLANAALLARGLLSLQRVETGISTNRLLTSRLWLPQPNEPSAGPYFTHEKRVALYQRIIDGLQNSPDIVHAGLATALPAASDSGTASISAEGWTPDRRDLATATPISVTPGYFRALNIRLVSGRLLEDTDDQRVPRVVVINETLARTYFGSEDPVGRRFRFVNRRGQVAPNAPWITIVGVVGDVKEDGLDLPTRPQIYQSLWQSSTLTLAIVAQGRAAAPAPASFQRALTEADPNLPLFAIRTGDELLEAQLAQRRFATYLIHAFAAAALLLAAFGLHGVIAYGVRQRTQEIGVRVALGATAARIMGLVLSQAARLTAAGIVLGIGGALVLSRLVAALPSNVKVADPWALSAVVVVVAVVVGGATLGAALRAAKIEAAVALRQD